MLEFANERQQEWDEELYSPEQFKKLMRIDGIIIYPDGGFEFAFSDGGMFGGHWIVVNGNLVEGPQDVTTAG